MIYLYHLKKPDASVYLSGKTVVMGQMLEAHFLHLLLALLGVVLLFLSLREGGGEEYAPKKRLLLLSASITGAYILYLSFISPIFPHYFAPLAPFVAILASEGLSRIFLFTAQLWKTTSRLGASGLGIILLILFSAAGYRTLFFYNLEQRALAFDLAPLIAERIKEKLRPDETIFGDFGVVPTVALLSGRRIAAAQVDSSVMRFVSGLYKVEDVIAAIEAAHVKAVLTRRGKDIAYYPPFHEYLKREFTLTETFATPKRGVPVELWIRR